MSEREEALNSYLFDLRTRAALSLEEVCARTKIQPRYVKALEEGRYDAVPSNTHLRAFSQALAQACGGDKARVALLVGRVLSAAAPVSAAPRSFDSKAPAPVAAAKPLPEVKPLPEAQAGGPSGAWVPASGPAMSMSASIAPLAAASARLRNLPLPALLGLLGLAGSLSFGTAWALDHWKRHSALQALASAATAVEAVKGSLPSAEAATAPPAAKAAPLPASADAAAAPLAPLPELELTLRARRDCWLVLQLDGQRLPTITMKDGDKFRYKFNDKAVLLAGNIGALRVWWRGTNLAYLGELGQRANAVVFERDKAPRFDAASALALPTGVPE